MFFDSFVCSCLVSFYIKSFLPLQPVNVTSLIKLHGAKVNRKGGGEARLLTACVVMAEKLPCLSVIVSSSVKLDNCTYIRVVVRTPKHSNSRCLTLVSCNTADALGCWKTLLYLYWTTSNMSLRLGMRHHLLGSFLHHGSHSFRTVLRTAFYLFPRLPLPRAKAEKSPIFMYLWQVQRGSK